MTYQIIFKRYAPFKVFGFGFHGDDRKEASLTGSARVWATINFDFEQGVIGEGVGYSDETWKASNPSLKKRSTPTVKISRANVNKKDGTVSFTAHSFGANPMISNSPDIDTYLDIMITKSAGTFSFKGKVRGDAFPNAEVFFKSPTGSKLLYHFQTKPSWYSSEASWKNLGPAALIGANTSQVLGSFYRVASRSSIDNS